MSREPTTIVSAAVAMARALDARGQDSRAIFRRAGLDCDQLDNPNARCSVLSMRRVWVLAVEATNDESFGLDVAEQIHPTTFYALGFAWLASRSLVDAFRRLERYHDIISTGADVQVSKTRDAYGVSIASFTTPPAPRWALDTFIASVVGLCRAVHGSSFAPMRVELPREEPVASQRYIDFFRCPVVFDAPRGLIEVDRSTAEQPLASANRELAEVNDEVAMQYLARLDRSKVSGKVRSALIEHLPAGEPSQQIIAKALDTSVRTLQRRLSDEQTSYKELLDNTRHHLALSYIKQKHFPVGEIAYLLGFADPSNFSRAFKRWTGHAPSSYLTNTENSGRV
jgi:AraC-like DNA-binding protein